MFLTVCRKLSFPAPAVEALHAAHNILQRDADLTQASRSFLTDDASPAEALKVIANKHDLPLATVAAVALIHAVPGLLNLYAQRHIAEEICWDTLIDLRCKLIENHDLEGIWGVEPITWYHRVFTLKILKLGRLEYEPVSYKWDKAYGDIARDCPVLNIHIPSCGSLPLEEVTDSLKQAYRFFGGKDSKALPFVCASWMLYPPMCEAVFPTGGNLHNFYKCFDIVEQYSDPENKHFWRIFGMRYDKEHLAEAPIDTSLRRRLLTWMLQGHDMGIGRGAFLFDGENILHVLP